MSTEPIFDPGQIYADIRAATERDKAEQLDRDAQIEHMRTADLETTVAGTDDRDAQFARLRAEDYEDPATVSEEPESPKPSPDTVAASIQTPQDPAIEYEPGEPAATVTLRHPFTFDGLRIDTLSMRPPTYGDVEAVVTQQISLLDMYARMAGVPVGALRALRWPDMEVFTKRAKHVAPPMERR